MIQADQLSRKVVTHPLLVSEEKLLVSRREAAHRLSISKRALDYLVANRQISTRRIGSRVLIAVSELHRFIRHDHPKPLSRRF